jgi:hypothetical protein
VNVYLRLWLTCPLLSASCCWRLYWLQGFPSPSTLGEVALHCLLQPVCLFTVHVGGVPSPLSSHCHFYKLSHSWLLGGCRHSCLLWPACSFKVPWGSAPLSLFGTQGSPTSLLLVFFLLLLLIQFGFFLFFPCMGVILSRGLCWSGPGLFVGVPHAT